MPFEAYRRFARPDGSNHSLGFFLRPSWTEEILLEHSETISELGALLLSSSIFSTKDVFSKSTLIYSQRDGSS
jgi:hypothetical protein